MIKPGGARRRRRSAFALPGIQRDMVVITAGRHESRARHALGQLEAEHPDIEIERAVEIGDFQMDMADPHAGIDGLVGFAVAHGRPRLSWEGASPYM